jgi:hypothetical protein
MPLTILRIAGGRHEKLPAENLWETKMEKNNSTRIDGLKRELEECGKAQWRSPSLFVGILGACAIGYHVVTDSHVSFLIGGIAGLSGFYLWAKLRRAYRDLAKVYEAELDAAKSQQ